MLAIGITSLLRHPFSSRCCSVATVLRAGDSDFVRLLSLTERPVTLPDKESGSNSQLRRVLQTDALMMEKQSLQPGMKGSTQEGGEDHRLSSLEQLGKRRHPAQRPRHRLLEQSPVQGLRRQQRRRSLAEWPLRHL